MKESLPVPATPCAALLAFAVAVACLAAPAPVRAQFKTELVASGIDLPLFCLSPPGDAERLFILEWKGRIRILKNGVLLERPFLDITDIVLYDAFERGLLGLAFDPNYDSNGWCYVYFINHATPFGSSVIRRFTTSADPDSADRGTMQRILTLPQVGADHNGGHVEFDAKGFLWLGLGDGANAQNNRRSQDPSNLFGKMLRIDPYSDDFPDDPLNNYAVPSDNPFVGQPGFRPEIWSYGLRNPYRFAFDPENQDLYIGDVGQGDWEEIDYERGGGLDAGRNYGWPIKEGTHCYIPPVDCDPGGLTDPVWEYSHKEGFAITGGRVYRGGAIPALRGLYFFGDYITDRVWTLRMVDGKAVDVRDRTAEVDPDGGLTLGNVAAFGEDAAGELYIVDLGGKANGQIFKIVPDPDAVGIAEGAGVRALTLTAAPNPFARETTVIVGGTRGRPIEVGVFAVNGRRVRTLRLHAGATRLAWDGRDDPGSRVPAGVYFVRAKSAQGEAATRVTLVD